MQNPTTNPSTFPRHPLPHPLPKSQRRPHHKQRPNHPLPPFSPSHPIPAHPRPLFQSQPGMSLAQAHGHTLAHGRIPFPALPPQHIMPDQVVHPVPTSTDPPQLTDEELAMKPRAHPHLTGPILYINNVPSDLGEEVIARALKECMPVRIKLELAVPPNVRIQPDEYYAWMPKSGTLTFDDMYHVEKAMAILSSHPLITFRSVFVSPYTFPNALPFGQSQARYIRPTQQVLAHPFRLSDPTDQFMTHCPSPGELFEAVRFWGSVREIKVWAEPPVQEGGPPSWGARIEFWYEDEARRFEIGFGQRGSHIKGYQVMIMIEPMQQMPFPIMISPYPQNGQLPNATPILPMGPVASSNFDVLPNEVPGKILPPEYRGINLDPQFNPPPMPHMQHPLPMTPPTSAVDYVPPWASHNPYTVQGTDLPFPHPITGPFPLSPNPTGQGLPIPHTPGMAQSTRHRANSSKASLNSLKSSRDRTWSLTLDQNPNGEMVPVGLIADDGTTLMHGPGQHIRPAPVFGPGSTSSSGLVDYSNVFVKSLDPDINTEFLADYFSRCGKIVSARVMRDTEYRSRGYGFVSFATPAEAARAIAELNGTRLGKQQIFVTLHEPKMIRPEKTAEMLASGSPIGYGRHHGKMNRSPSVRPRPVAIPVEEKSPATLDIIRSYTPVSRKAALDQRVRPVVKAYVQVHKIPDFYLEPTIKALADDDLALIPLLHDHEGLVAKIAETISDLQIEFDVAKAAAAAASQTSHTSSDRTSEEVATPTESELSPAPEEVPLPSSQIEILPSTPRLDYLTATMSDLISLDTKDILANIEGDGGAALMTKLGVARPTQHEQDSIRAWTTQTMAKIPLTRKSEMSTMLGRKLDMTYKRHQRVKVAKEIVNQETDHEALCLLMAYPKLINAKVKMIINKAKTIGSK